MASVVCFFLALQRLGVCTCGSLFASTRHVLGPTPPLLLLCVVLSLRFAYGARVPCMHTKCVIVQRTHANEINIKPESIIYETGNISIESVFPRNPRADSMGCSQFNLLIGMHFASIESMLCFHRPSSLAYAAICNSLYFQQFNLQLCTSCVKWLLNLCEWVRRGKNAHLNAYYALNQTFSEPIKTLHQWDNFPSSLALHPKRYGRLRFCPIPRGLLISWLLSIVRPFSATLGWNGWLIERTEIEYCVQTCMGDRGTVTELERTTKAFQ